MHSLLGDLGRFMMMRWTWNIAFVFTKDAGFQHTWLLHIYCPTVSSQLHLPTALSSGSQPHAHSTTQQHAQLIPVSLMSVLLLWLSSTGNDTAVQAHHFHNLWEAFYLSSLPPSRFEYWSLNYILQMLFTTLKIWGVYTGCLLGTQMFC